MSAFCRMNVFEHVPTVDEAAGGGVSAAVVAMEGSAHCLSVDSLASIKKATPHLVLSSFPWRREIPASVDGANYLRQLQSASEERIDFLFRPVHSAELLGEWLNNPCHLKHDAVRSWMFGKDRARQMPVATADVANRAERRSIIPVDDGRCHNFRE